MKYLISLFLLLFFFKSIGQIGVGTVNIHQSAILELQSTSKGFLMPRLNNIERNNIENPVEGLSIYNTTSNCIQYYNGLDWFDPCCARDVSNSFAFSSSHFVFDPINESSFVKMNVNNGIAESGTPIHNDFIHSLKDDANNRVLDYEAGSTDIASMYGHAVYQFKDSASTLSYKSNRFVSRVTETVQGAFNSASHFRYLQSPPLQEAVELFLIARIDHSTNSPSGAIFNSHQQGSNGHYTFGIQSGTPASSTCTSNYYVLSYSTPTQTSTRICGTGNNRVKIDDGKFHLFHVKSEDDPQGSTDKLLSFSIDGVLVDSVLIDNYVKFNAFKIFTNQTSNSAVKADIKFLSISPILSVPEFDDIINYLNCKYLD